MQNETISYMELLQHFHLVFFMYGVMLFVPVCNTIKLYCKKQPPRQSELFLDMGIHFFILLGLFLGFIFQIRLADFPAGTQYAGWSYQLVIIAIFVIVVSVIYCVLSYRRFRFSQIQDHRE